jgi:hypothetical protein
MAEPEKTLLEEIEYGQEAVSSTEAPYGYDRTKDAGKLSAMSVTQSERLGLALVSLIAASGLPISLGALWGVLASSGGTVWALVLFLIIIFIVPLTTIFSWITGYIAFQKSKKAGRYIAIGSFAVSGIGLILLILFINGLDGLAQM